MLKTVQQIGTSTPYLWWRQSDELSFSTILGVLLVPLSLMHTARDQVVGVDTDQQALARILPSSLLFTATLCLLTTVALMSLPPFAKPGFVASASRFVRQFCLCMLFIAVPFFFRTIGYGAEIVFGGDFSVNSDTLRFMNGDEIRFALVYSGIGSVAYLTLMIFRGWWKLKPILMRHPDLMNTSLSEPLMALLISLSVCATTVFSTYVVLSWELPSWMSVIKPTVLGN